MSRLTKLFKKNISNKPCKKKLAAKQLQELRAHALQNTHEDCKTCESKMGELEKLIKSLKIDV